MSSRHCSLGCSWRGLRSLKAAEAGSKGLRSLVSSIGPWSGLPAKPIFSPLPKETGKLPWQRGELIVAEPHSPGLCELGDLWRQRGEFPARAGRWLGAAGRSRLLAEFSIRRVSRGINYQHPRSQRGVNAKRAVRGSRRAAKGNGQHANGSQPRRRAGVVDRVCMHIWIQLMQ